MSDSAFGTSVLSREQSTPPNMVWIPGGTFRMGSDRHYPEEAPAHSVSVGGFWIDQTPVTNRQFKEFVRSTGHKTFAEIPPDPKNYPGALPHMLYAGSLVFTPPQHPVDLKNLGEWWAYTKGADWRHPYGPRSFMAAALDYGCTEIMAEEAERRTNGSSLSEKQGVVIFVNQFQKSGKGLPLCASEGGALYSFD